MLIPNRIFKYTVSEFFYTFYTLYIFQTIPLILKRGNKHGFSTKRGNKRGFGINCVPKGKFA